MEKTEDKGLRCYTMINTYLIGIHGGVQSTHAAVRMIRKYEKLPVDTDVHRMRNTIIDWADNHETVIAVSGGMHGDLIAMEEFLSSDDNEYPWAVFQESEYALAGAYTAISIILPEKVFSPEYIESYVHQGLCPYVGLSPYEIELYEKIRKMRLVK